jgi:hypothetical protein
VLIVPKSHVRLLLEGRRTPFQYVKDSLSKLIEPLLRGTGLRGFMLMGWATRPVAERFNIGVFHRFGPHCKQNSERLEFDGVCCCSSLVSSLEACLGPCQKRRFSEVEGRIHRRRNWCSAIIGGILGLFLPRGNLFAQEPTRGLLPYS